MAGSAGAAVSTTRSSKRVRFSLLDEDGLRQPGELFVYVDKQQVASIEKTGSPGYWGAYTIRRGRVRGLRGYFDSQRAAKEHVVATLAEQELEVQP